MTNLKRIVEERNELLGIVQWMSAASDFQEGGVARVGFERMVRPVLGWSLLNPDGTGRDPGTLDGGLAEGE